MKVDMTQTLLGVDGNPVHDETGEAVVLRALCINALMAVMEEDKNQSGEEKLKADELARRLYNEDMPDLTPEELAKLKERVGKMYGAVVVGPIYRILNGEAAG